MSFFWLLNVINLFIIKFKISYFYATNMIRAFQQTWCQWGTAVMILSKQNVSNSDKASLKLDVSDYSYWFVVVILIITIYLCKSKYLK